MGSLSSGHRWDFNVWRQGIQIMNGVGVTNKVKRCLLETLLCHVHWISRPLAHSVAVTTVVIGFVKPRDSLNRARFPLRRSGAHDSMPAVLSTAIPTWSAATSPRDATHRLGVAMWASLRVATIDTTRTRDECGTWCTPWVFPSHVHTLTWLEAC